MKPLFECFLRKSAGYVRCYDLLHNTAAEISSLVFIFPF